MAEPAQTLLQHAEVIVCCDGAYDTFRQHPLNSQAAIVVTGDGDSLSSSLDNTKTTFIPDKSVEYNDLQKALKYCQQQDFRRVLLTGCEGKREDHFIANLSIMATYSESMDLTMLTAHGMFNVIRKSATLPSFQGQQVSVFSTDHQLPLSFEGLKYPVKERCFQHLWEGSLNEATGEEFTIVLHGEGLVIVYQALAVR
ncbi:MAG: thiamine diphosphokinase [Bacteroidales bacterium]|nr:thiamine diphosphokinase [Bacteroidales bacterium]